MPSPPAAAKCQNGNLLKFSQADKAVARELRWGARMAGSRGLGRDFPGAIKVKACLLHSQYSVALGKMNYTYLEGLQTNSTMG